MPQTTGRSYPTPNFLPTFNFTAFDSYDYLIKYICVERINSYKKQIFI